MKKEGLAQKKKEKNMQLIMHDALHYFEKNGYDNTTVEQLCEAAMISQSTFFNYFGNKEKVVRMIMEDGLNDYEKYVETALKKDEDPFKILEDCLDFQVNVTEKYCNITSVFHRLAFQNEIFRELEAKYNKVTADLIEGTFKRAGCECPIDKEALEDFVGGYFVEPYLILPHDQIGDRLRKTTNVFISLMRNFSNMRNKQV